VKSFVLIRETSTRELLYKFSQKLMKQACIN